MFVKSTRFKEVWQLLLSLIVVRSVEEDRGCKMGETRESDGMSSGVTIPCELCGLQIQFRAFSRRSGETLLGY